jgi:predicted RNA binding protein YcfA (HicA-like mRNA interferase family)
MPKLRRLSGKDLVKFFEKCGFVISRQKGSHIILERIVENVSQHLVVPNHAELDRGTTHEIFKQARIYIPESELRKVFYTD